MALKWTFRLVAAHHLRFLAAAGVVLAAGAFMGATIQYANSNYPHAATDFGYFIPRILDSHLHYSINGLSIQWFTPTFGGGLPAYPNPQHLQFSLIQFLTFFASPWKSIWLAFCIYVCLGFLAGYYFNQRILGLQPLASALGAVFFNVNGFVFSHAVVGHVTYQLFPLLPLVLVALLHPTWSSLQKGLLLSAIFFANLQSGGFIVLVIYALSVSMMLPMVFAAAPRSVGLRNLVGSLASALLASVLLSGSKLHAVMSFMQLFPRRIADTYGSSPLEGIVGIVLQLFGTSAFALVSRLRAGTELDQYMTLLHSHIGTSEFGLWELDVSVSPAIPIVLLIMLPLVLARNRSVRGWAVPRRTVIALALGLVAAWIGVEFCIGKGLVYPALQELPILGSLHINPRFTAGFIMPVSTLAALVFDRFERHTRAMTVGIVFAVLAVLSLWPVGNLFEIPRDYFGFDYRLSDSEKIYRQIAAGRDFGVDAIGGSIDATQALMTNASDPLPYEALFGYGLQDFRPLVITGSIWLTDGEYYNMTNPASLVFPRENDLYPFERMRVSEVRELRLFADRRQPPFIRPGLQVLLDWSMGISWLTLCLLLAYQGIGCAATIVRRASERGRPGVRAAIRRAGQTTGR